MAAGERTAGEPVGDDVRRVLADRAAALAKVGRERQRADALQASFDRLVAHMTESDDAGIREMSAAMRIDSERWFPRLHCDKPWDLVVAYTLGLSGEAGEVANLIKKMNRDYGDETVAAADGLAEELADVFTYLLLLAGELEVDLAEAWRSKRAVNESRWGATGGPSDLERSTRAPLPDALEQVARVMRAPGVPSPETWSEMVAVLERARDELDAPPHLLAEDGGTS